MSDRVRSVVGGVLLANCVPHVATALTGRKHLTPLAGRGSSARVNGIWAVLNLVGAGLLLRGLVDSESWGRELWDVEAGALGWMTWMAASERLMGVNTAND